MRKICLPAIIKAMGLQENIKMLPLYTANLYTLIGRGLVNAILTELLTTDPKMPHTKDTLDVIADFIKEYRRMIKQTCGRVPSDFDSEVKKPLLTLYVTTMKKIPLSMWEDTEVSAAEKLAKDEMLFNPFELVAANQGFLAKIT